VLGKLAQEYNSETCLVGNPARINRSAPNFPKSGDCLYGEPDLERLMKRTDLAPEQLSWIWLNWHDSVGPRIKDVFSVAVEYQNDAAKNNGTTDLFHTFMFMYYFKNLITSVSSKSSFILTK
jgi:hypothetical protein